MSASTPASPGDHDTENDDAANSTQEEISRVRRRPFARAAVAFVAAGITIGLIAIAIAFAALLGKAAPKCTVDELLDRFAELQGKRVQVTGLVKMAVPLKDGSDS